MKRFVFLICLGLLGCFLFGCGSKKEKSAGEENPAATETVATETAEKVTDDATEQSTPEAISTPVPTPLPSGAPILDISLADQVEKIDVYCSTISTLVKHVSGREDIEHIVQTLLDKKVIEKDPNADNMSYYYNGGHATSYRFQFYLYDGTVREVYLSNTKQGEEPDRLVKDDALYLIEELSWEWAGEGKTDDEEFIFNALPYSAEYPE